MKRNNILQIALFATIVVYCSVFTKSCANTTGSPTGGPKDTIPPVLVNVMPGNNQLNVPLTKGSIQLFFDEYVVLKDASNQIFLSPPTPKKLQTKIKGKSIIITYEDTLKPNTTYTIDFGEGIQDNNEGNIFPHYVYAFSTGDHIDSLYFTGSILNATTMLPEKGVTIALYKDHSDSAIFLSTPDAMSRSDEWGFFSLRNLSDTLYRVYAYNDLNFNYKYDQDVEMIAFLDSSFRPYKAITSGIKELAYVDKKDTLAAMSRIPDINLYLFKENPTRQYLTNSGRIAERAAFLKFSAPYVKIDSIGISGYDSTQLITQFNTLQDSLLIWINDQKAVPDTLFLDMVFQKTDSTGVLVPTNERVRLIQSGGNTSRQSGQRRYTKTEDTPKDTLLKIATTAVPENIDQDGIILMFEFPLIEQDWEKIKLNYQTPRLQTIEEPITIIPDSTEIRRFTIKPDNPSIAGNDYTLRIPKNVFKDINNLPNDSLNIKFALPIDEDLSTLFLELTDVESNYIVELISEKRDKVFRTYRIDDDTTLRFPYLKAGKYSVRITQDLNNNGIIDTGSLLERRQPEKVLLYKPGEGSTDAAYILDIPEKVELTQTINIGEMFR